MIIITFIQQGWVKVIKSHSKDIYNTTKDFKFKWNLYRTHYDRPIEQIFDFFFS